jgi:hypothetical protein
MIHILRRLQWLFLQRVQVPVTFPVLLPKVAVLPVVLPVVLQRAANKPHVVLGVTRKTA